MGRLSNRSKSATQAPPRVAESGRSLDRGMAVGAFGALIAGEAVVAVLLPTAGICLLACTGAMGYLQHRSERRRASAAPAAAATTAAPPSRAELPGRPELLDQAGRDIARAKRYGFPLTLAVIDVPKYEQLSAAWDEETTADIAAHLADRVRHAMRESDFLARVAPDRFIATLMDCTAEQADGFAERVARSVGARPILTGEKGCLPVQLAATVSSLQFAAQRFPDAPSFIAEAEGEPAPVSIAARVRPDGRDVRMLRRELVKDAVPEPLERAS